MSALIGAWRLVSCEATSSDGTRFLPLGENAAGLLVYDVGGMMSVAIMCAGRARFNASDILAGTVEERAAAAASYMSYAGRWELVGERVRHAIEISLFPNWVGSVQERHVSFDDNTLVLATDPIVFGAATRVVSMRWHRA